MRFLFALILAAAALAAQSDSSFLREPARVTGAAEVNGKLVRWVDRGGYAVVGDIVIGTTEEALGSNAKSGEPGKTASFAVGQSLRWPNGVVPYTVDAAVNSVSATRITAAIEEWNSKTPIRLVPRTAETDYVRFRRIDPGACYSSVGRVGGPQVINLGDGCDTGATIHEIGHAVGLWHEQSRQDRDYYVQVEYPDIDRANWDQYDIQYDDGIDYAHYDYGSIMHYSSDGFAANVSPTMRSIPAGIPLGQRTGLSPFDIAAVNNYYGRANQIVIATNPSGLKVFVDGQEITTPRTYDWADGSEHTIAAEGTQSTSDVLRYVFGRWSDNGPARHTIRVNRRETPVFMANFIQQFKLPVNNAPGGRVQVVNASADGFYTIDQPVTVQAIPDAGYRFVSWSADSAGYFRTLGNANNPHTIPQLATIHTVTPVFTQGPITRITSNQPQTSVLIGNVEHALPAQFAWTAGSSHTINAQSSVSDGVQFNGIDLVAFQNWSVGAARLQNITASSSDTTIQASFSRSVEILTARVGTGTGVISVSPASSSGYFPVGSQVTLSAAGFSAQFLGWSGDASGADNPLVLTADGQKLIVGAFRIPGQLTASAVVDAATYSGAGVAPGQIVTLFGVSIGPDQASGPVAVNRVLLTDINGTSVKFDGVAAPIIYLSADQISVVVPYSIAAKAANRETVRVEVTSPGRSVNSVFVPTRPAGPAIFTRDSSGSGNCACLNENGSVNSNLNPAPKGSVVVLYATGEGQTVPAGVDGLLATGATTRPVLPIRARVGGREAIVDYAGAAPGFTAGTMQVNVRIPSDIGGGNVPVQLFAGEEGGLNTVTVAVQQ